MAKPHSEEREGFCTECGEPAYVQADGVSHHAGDGIEGINYDLDADHVALVPDETMKKEWRHRWATR